MKHLFITILAVSIASFSALASATLPDGWFQAGSNDTDYEMGVDENKGYRGKKSAYIESIKPNPKGFSTLMQNASAAEYLGKRIQMTVFISTKNVSEWTGAWLRVDANGKMLSLDNMSGRGIKGTTDWEQYSIVLDVPKNATNMAFGILLNGPGKVWFDGFNFEIVDNNVPLTNLSNSQLSAPKNLGFEND